MADGDSTATARGELSSPHPDPHFVYNVVNVDFPNGISVVIEVKVGMELAVDGELENESDVLDNQVGTAFHTRD